MLTVAAEEKNPAFTTIIMTKKYILKYLQKVSNGQRRQ
jgi:hypothetical protein